MVPKGVTCVISAGVHLAPRLPFICPDVRTSEQLRILKGAQHPPDGVSGVPSIVDIHPGAPAVHRTAGHTADLAASLRCPQTR